MKVTVKYEFSAAQIFQQVENSALYDMSQALGRECKPSSLHPGATYKKELKTQFGKKAGVRVNIIRFKRPYEYEVAFTSSQGVYHINYDFKDLPKGCELTYEEKFIGNGTFSNLNYKFMASLQKKRNEKRLRQQLLSIEDYLVENPTQGE